MIDRYMRAEMAGIWSDERRFQLMLELETAFLEFLAREKKIPQAEIRALRAVAGKPLAARVKEKEATSGHEIVALLQVLSAELKGKAPSIDRYLHYGLTSSDVMDTVLALQLKEASDLLLKGWKSTAAQISRLAVEHETTWMVGRTHGVHAEPLTFGVKLAGWHAEAMRCIDRVAAARETIAFGKLSGAVGTFSQLSPALEAAVLRKFGLKPEPVATQVIPRDRHADYFHALVLSATAIERFALEIRHLQRTEVLEAEEPFTEGQKGSSAMPHKRNPILCENLCGLARLVRAYEAAVVENVPLWHERDISHSSVERVVMPDATILLDFMLHRFSRVLEGLQVYPERMKHNLDRSLGLVFSQRILLRLIDKGLGRLKAYELVQRNAMKTWTSQEPFMNVLLKDPEVVSTLPAKELRSCFDLNGYRKSARELLRRGGVN
ncbi:MAG: adenylosuccinate lyase [Elusimicrobia bacterium]|nr:adenylosuccinate lyase [Elusimicrobiota bacterium]